MFCFTYSGNCRINVALQSYVLCITSIRFLRIIFCTFACFERNCMFCFTYSSNCRIDVALQSYILCITSIRFFCYYFLTCIYFSGDSFIEISNCIYKYAMLFTIKDNKFINLCLQSYVLCITSIRFLRIIFCTFACFKRNGLFCFTYSGNCHIDVALQSYVLCITSIRFLRIIFCTFACFKRNGLFCFTYSGNCRVDVTL